MSSRHGLEIRGLGEGDAAGLAQLLATCGLAADPRRVAERIANLKSVPGAALVAQEWGPPSGVVVAHWSYALSADAPSARIDLLLVAPADRGRGVARLLVKAAAQAARQAGCAALRLAVPADATGLAAFAAASGFETAGTELVRPLRKRG